jgi:two-component system, chemotaxis family, chemotaxis protein CheY
MDMLSARRTTFMKTLILEDDFAARLVLHRILLEFGEVDVAGNGKEAMGLFFSAHEKGSPYEVAFVDLMVPEMSGQSVLYEMRAYEAQKKISKELAAKILVTTALSDKENVVQAIKNGCDAYIIKPLTRDVVWEQLRRFGKIP